MITNASVSVTYDDGTTASFTLSGTPAVEAKGVDFSSIPTSPAKVEPVVAQ